MKTQFSRVAAKLKDKKNFAKFKKWYKKHIHRLNRRKANQNPEYNDKKLDAWDID
ncbi:MAG: hypothetical protein ACFFG0_15570 [Candidatus Thorarchaeota archaeon]